MVNLSDSLVQARIASGICTIAAILPTLFRLHIRTQRQLLWIEDFWAAISMCTLVTQMIAVFIKPSASAGVIRYYIISNMFYATTWCARQSILFSIIRIRKAYPIRTLSWIAATFLVAWMVLTAQVYWECEKKTAWKYIKIPQCQLSPIVAICQISADVTSDGILLYYSTRQFMDILDKKLRRRLTLLFGTCFMTTIASVCHATYLLRSKAHPIMISAFIENAVSLIVCNIPVVITTVFKLKKEERFLSSSDRVSTPVFAVPDPIEGRQDHDSSNLHLRKLYSPLSPL